jgi:hypothetical protein
VSGCKKPIWFIVELLQTRWTLVRVGCECRYPCTKPRERHENNHYPVDCCVPFCIRWRSSSPVSVVIVRSREHDCDRCPLIDWLIWSGKFPCLQSLWSFALAIVRLSVRREPRRDRSCDGWQSCESPRFNRCASFALAVEDFNCSLRSSSRSNMQ